MLAINYLQRCRLVQSEQLRLLGEVKAGVSLLPLPEGVAHLRVTVTSTSQQLRENTLLSAYSPGQPEQAACSRHQLKCHRAVASFLWVFYLCHVGEALCWTLRY